MDRFRCESCNHINVLCCTLFEEPFGRIEATISESGIHRMYPPFLEWLLPLLVQVLLAGPL